MGLAPKSIRFLLYADAIVYTHFFSNSNCVAKASVLLPGAA